MTIDEEIHGRTHVLVLRGSLNASTAELLATRLDTLMSAGHTQVLLDCDGLSYVNSVGLRVLLVGAKKAKAAGGSLTCCRLQPMVREVFDLSQFGSVVVVHPDRVAALDALAQGH